MRTHFAAPLLRLCSACYTLVPVGLKADCPPSTRSRRLEKAKIHKTNPFVAGPKTDPLYKRSFALSYLRSLRLNDTNAPTKQNIIPKASRPISATTG